MSNIPDISHLTSVELRQVISTAERLIDSKIKQEREAARKAAEDAIKSFGFTLEDIFGNPMRAAPATRKRGESVGVPKFRNPENKDETWTGRGRKPRWFAALDAEGQELARLAADD